MRALRYPDCGVSPEIVDVPTPEPAAGEVVIRVEATALNFADLLMGEGRYQAQPAFPLIPGMEVAGLIERAGAGSDPTLIGRRVVAFTGFGGLAERVAVPASHCSPVPDGVAAEAAAAVPVAYGTAHLALGRTGHLARGETLVVTGASGGVGLTAVELACLMGARVVAVARGAEKGAVARRAGADHVLDSDRDDLTTEIRRLGGADVVFDTVGGPGLRSLISATRPEGRILLIGFASGTLPELRPNHLLVKNISVHGFYWGGFMDFAPGVLTDSLGVLLGWLAEGRITPHISHRLPLERAAEGLALLRDRKSTGKVVITP